MKKVKLLTPEGEKDIICPAYFKDDSVEDALYLYKIHESDNDVSCTRIKIIQIDDFYSYEIASTNVITALSYKESNVLEWAAGLGKVTDFLNKFI